MKEEMEMPTFDADSEEPTAFCKSSCLIGIMCSLNYYMLKEIWINFWISEWLKK